MTSATDALNRRSLVKAIWSASGNADEAVLPGVVVPDAHVELVFHLADPWRMRCADQPAWRPQPSAFVLAQSQGVLRFQGEGLTSIVAFRVTPVVACAILRRPIHDIWNEPVSLRDLVGADADALCERLRASEAAERLPAVMAWIERRLADWSTENFNLQRLCNRVMWSPPTGGLTTLSRRLRWSDRGLRRAITRAERLQLDITEIAGRVGFCDHAAFTHSFRERLGMTPSQFRAESHAFYERRP